MAASLKAGGTWSTPGTTTPLTVTMPGTPAVGDRKYVFAVWKDFAITATCASNSGARPYAEVTEFADGSVATGNGLGSMKVAAWYKDHESGDDNPQITFSSGTGLLRSAVAQVWQKGGSDSWLSPSFATAAISAASPFSATASSDVDIPDGAVVIELIGLRDDSVTLTRDSNTALDDDGSPAVTWNGNVVEEPATHLDTTTGNDLSGDIVYRLVTTGANGVTLTATGTPAAGETGSVLWVVQPASVVTEDPTPYVGGGYYG